MDYQYVKPDYLPYTFTPIRGTTRFDVKVTEVECYLPREVFNQISELTYVYLNDTKAYQCDNHYVQGNTIYTKFITCSEILKGDLNKIRITANPTD